ncbi:hypothetical protein CR513_45199, partial [Mucuna pruriens]
MKKDSAACYDIESKIFNTIQGTLSVIEYYGTLNELWIELDQYQGLKMYKVDSIAYTRLVERGRIFKFLYGLNSEYDLIRSEETRRSVVLDKGNSNIGSTKVPPKDQLLKENPSQRVVMENTVRIANDHAKDTCYKRYGKEKVLERISGNKCLTQMWVNQTTSDKENELTTERMIGVAKEQGGLQPDNDTEFVNLEFSKFLKDNGVVQLICVNTPQQNGVAERKNRHLLEVARALLFQMSVPNLTLTL